MQKLMRKKAIQGILLTETGFTIVEFIIATAIISLISSIAIPNYVGQLCRAESSESVT
jgi:prepilin-type N-terminal cleavage/methylation domain-containing protein